KWSGWSCGLLDTRGVELDAPDYERQRLEEETRVEGQRVVVAGRPILFYSRLARWRPIGGVGVFAGDILLHTDMRWIEDPIVLLPTAVLTVAFENGIALSFTETRQRLAHIPRIAAPPRSPPWLLKWLPDLQAALRSKPHDESSED